MQDRADPHSWEFPDLIFVKPRFEVYKAVSQQIAKSSPSTPRSSNRFPWTLNLVFLAFRLGACGNAAPGSREPSRKASRPSGFDPSRDHESLAGGTRPRSRRHFMPASLSRPFVRVPF